MGNKFKVILLLAVLACSFSFCKKSEVSKSKKDMLVAKTWKETAQNIAGTDVAIDACNQDDVNNFSSNGTYVFSVGTIKCDATDTNSTGTWTISADEKTLTIIDSRSGTVTFTITDMNETKLVLSTTQAGIPITVTFAGI